MPLVLTQTIRHYTDLDRSVRLRVLTPSLPHGYWPGNTHTIREWKATDTTEMSLVRSAKAAFTSGLVIFVPLRCLPSGFMDVLRIGERQRVSEHFTAYETCSDADVRRYEAELGEINPYTISFAEHATLGRVVVVK